MPIRWREAVPAPETARVVAIIQARTASRRLPGKVLADIGGAPMLLRVVERTQRASLVEQVVVATTMRPADDAVADLCAGHAIECFRGSATDVLDRIYHAAKAYRADVVVRITGDCPLIDPEVIDATILAFLQADPPVDLVANRLPEGRTFPIGLDTEVCSLAALETAWKLAEAPYQREHVMPFLYDPPGRFKVLRVDSPVDLGHLRWTVDVPQDLEFVRAVYAAFMDDSRFGWQQVVRLVQDHPELMAINAEVVQKRHTDVD